VINEQRKQNNLDDKNTMLIPLGIINSLKTKRGRNKKIRCQFSDNCSSSQFFKMAAAVMMMMMTTMTMRTCC